MGFRDARLELLGRVQLRSHAWRRDNQLLLPHAIGIAWAQTLSSYRQRLSGQQVSCAKRRCAEYHATYTSYAQWSRTWNMLGSACVGSMEHAGHVRDRFD